MGVTVKIVVKDDQGTPQPVEDVRIRVFDAGDAFVTELDTDSNGEADVVLDGDPDPGRNYILRFFKSGWRFTNGTSQVIKVHEPLVSPATNVFDIEATLPILPESPHPDMCLISGYLGNTARQPLRDVTLRFKPQLDEPDAIVSGFPFPGDPTVVDGTSLIAETAFKTNENGYVEIQLPRRGVYDVHLYGLETPGPQIIAQIFVPDRASAKLEDVLFPYVANVVWDQSAMVLDVDESKNLVATVTGVNDQPLNGQSVFSALMEFTIDDSAVASIIVDEDGVIGVRGLSPGVANISAARKDNTSAPRRPPIPDLVVTPVTQVSVTVT